MTEKKFNQHFKQLQFYWRRKSSNFVYFELSFCCMFEGKNAIIQSILLYHNKLLHRIALHFKINLKANIRGQNMRKVIDIQMKFGEVDISKIEFDLQSRDEIPKLLMGVKEIYCNLKVRDIRLDLGKNISFSDSLLGSMPEKSFARCLVFPEYWGTKKRIKACARRTSKSIGNVQRCLHGE